MAGLALAFLFLERVVESESEQQTKKEEGVKEGVPERCEGKSSVRAQCKAASHRGRGRSATVHLV